MKLRDKFLFQEPPPSTSGRGAPLGVMKEALRGIGDRETRVAQDFLWSMGVAPMAGAEGMTQWVPAAGDAVEFTVPNSDGLRRAGRIQEVQGRDALVQVNAGEFNLVPLQRLSPLSSEARRAERRSALQEALAGRGGLHLHETRALIQVSPTDYAMTLEYTAGVRPTSEDVDAYVASRYPGARIVDGDDTHPGKFGLVLSFKHTELGHRALTASRAIFSQAEPPSSRANAVGIGKEEIEGTGKIADDESDGTLGGGGEDLQPLGMGNAVISTEKRSMLESSAKVFERMAARFPAYDFTETSVEETTDGFVSHFKVTGNGRPLFIRDGALTPVLAEGVEPAIGQVAVSGGYTLVHLGSRMVADYDSGTGPLSMRENEPGANDSGSYVVKADAPPGKEPMVRELKHAPGVDNPYAVAWSQYNKEHHHEGDFDQEGKIPTQDIDYRKEQERYELEQAETNDIELRNKQRRLERQKQLKRPSQTVDPITGLPVYTGQLRTFVDGVDVTEHVISAELQAGAPATEEDGEVREHIGGPGLHIAVDEKAEDYWADYFGEYGDQLTKDVARRQSAMIRQAWAEETGQEPTAEEFFWVLGVLTARSMSRTAEDPNKSQRPQLPNSGEFDAWLEQNQDELHDAYDAFSQGQDPPTSRVESRDRWYNFLNQQWQAQGGAGAGAGAGGAAPAAGGAPAGAAPGAPAGGATPPKNPASATPAGPTDMTELANALIEATHLDPRVMQRLMPAVTKELAKMPEQQRSRYRPDDPKVLQQLLPTVLHNMDLKTRNELTYEFAPELGGTAPGKLKQLWRNLPGGGPDVEKTRQQMQYGKQFDKNWKERNPGKTPKAPGGPGEGVGGGGGGGGGTPGTGGGRRVTIPAGTKVIDSQGQPYTLPADMPMMALQDFPAGAPAVPPGAAPAAPASPAQTPSAPASPAAPQPAPIGAPRAPAPAAGSSVGAGLQKGAWVELPSGSSLNEMNPKTGKAKPTTLKAALHAQVISTGEEAGGATFLKAQDGKIYIIEPLQGAQASRRTADAATDAYPGRRPPAHNQLRFRMEGLVRRGDYLVAAVVWDADACAAMAPSNVVANLKRYIVQRAGEKEFIDLGFIGNPRIENLDLSMGLAEVRFRSSNPGAGPLETVEREDASYHELT